MLEQLPQTAQEHFWRIIETTLPLVVFLLESRRRAKREQQKQHEENQKAIAEIVTQNRFLPAHKHDEKSGTLTVDGISYVPKLS